MLVGALSYLFSKRFKNLVLGDFTALYDCQEVSQPKTCQLSFSLYRACLLITHIPRTDRQGLPDFTTLSSNNPFRKFSAIPAPYNNSLPSPAIAQCEPSTIGPERPLSRNPFLDQTDFKNLGGPLPRPGSPGREMLRINGNTSIMKNEGSIGNAVDLFVRIYPNRIL